MGSGGGGGGWEALQRRRHMPGTSSGTKLGAQGNWHQAAPCFRAPSSFRFFAAVSTLATCCTTPTPYPPSHPSTTLVRTRARAREPFTSTPRTPTLFRSLREFVERLKFNRFPYCHALITNAGVQIPKGASEAGAGERAAMPLAGECTPGCTAQPQGEARAYLLIYLFTAQPQPSPACWRAGVKGCTLPAATKVGTNAADIS